MLQKHLGVPNHLPTEHEDLAWQSDSKVWFWDGSNSTLVGGFFPHLGLGEEREIEKSNKLCENHIIHGDNSP